MLLFQVSGVPSAFPSFDSSYSCPSPYIVPGAAIPMRFGGSAACQPLLTEQSAAWGQSPDTLRG